VFSAGNGNTVATSDPDAGTNPVKVTIGVTAGTGTLTLSGTTGLTFTTGDGTADQTMTFTGTLANINTALSGLRYDPAGNFAGATTFTITTDDQGNTGTGGALN